MPSFRLDGEKKRLIAIAFLVVLHTLWMWIWVETLCWEGWNILRVALYALIIAGIVRGLWSAEEGEFEISVALSWVIVMIGFFVLCPELLFFGPRRVAACIFS